MRYIICTLILAACAASISCGGSGETSPVANGNAAQPAASRSQRSDAQAGTNTVAPAGVTAAHGNGNSSSADASSSDKPPLETAAIDEKIRKAEAKAKAQGASAADKKAAAASYLERANVYYSAQDTRLYRFALGDFRRVLRYEPDNEEAKAKIDMIVSIYGQLNRPVPTNGLEP